MKFKITTLFFLVTSGLLFSQTESSNQSETSAADNLWAIQFQISENFKLNSFDGSTISLKKKLSDYSSLRTDIAINTSFLNMENEVFSPFGNMNKNTTIDDNDQLGFTINVLYLLNSVIKNEVTVYYGLGPSFSIGYNRVKSHYENGNNESLEVGESISQQNTFGLGISGAVGIEWYVKENISLLGEYEVSASYLYSIRKSENSRNSIIVNTSNSTDNNFYFSSHGVKLGVSVYF